MTFCSASCQVIVIGHDWGVQYVQLGPFGLRARLEGDAEDDEEAVVARTLANCKSRKLWILGHQGL